MKIEIKHRYNGSILFAGEYANTREAVEAAVAAGANLAGANLADAYLADANLADANLADAYLARANLARANLAGANLADANLARAYLADANLAGANLADAYLARAYLTGANLADANLADAKGSDLAIAMTRILPEGDIIGWKKVITPGGDGIVKLRIPAEAKRSSAFGRKCRAEYADVLEAPEGAYTVAHGPRTEYKAGERVTPDKWDDNWMKECSNGIHFFITRVEAESY